MPLAFNLVEPYLGFFYFFPAHNPGMYQKTSKRKFYITVIRLIVTYANETWVLKLEDMKNLGLYERKILRIIYGPVWDAEMWRIRKNRELRDPYGEADIVAAVKAQRLRSVSYTHLL